MPVESTPPLHTGIQGNYLLFPSHCGLQFSEGKLDELNYASSRVHAFTHSGAVCLVSISLEPGVTLGLGGPYGAESTQGPSLPEAFLFVVKLDITN